MTVQRMDNIGIVVDDLEATIAYFVELGLEMESEATVEGQWVDRIVGLDGVRNDIAMLRAPDGHGRLELIKFHTPPATTAEPNAPGEHPGHTFGSCSPSMTSRRSLPASRPQGAELVGEVVQYEDKYLLCYVRGPEGICQPRPRLLTEESELWSSSVLGWYQSPSQSLRLRPTAPSLSMSTSGCLRDLPGNRLASSGISVSSRAHAWPWHSTTP